MNVYDFDGTIYNGDSTVDFYLYALKTKPSLIRFLPKQLLGFVLYWLKKIDKTKFKEYFFSFLSAINTEELVESFWDTNQRNICDWYLKQQKPNDIIISASPDFLLNSICKRLGIDFVIASKVDFRTGKFLEENCWGQRKVQCLMELYNINKIDNFYSDSHSDLPLVGIANNAYFVKKGLIREWKEEDHNMQLS